MEKNLSVSCILTDRKAVYGISKVKIDEQVFNCFSWKEFEELYLKGDFEQLQEQCFTPWDCKGCSNKFRVMRSVYGKIRV